MTRRDPERAARVAKAQQAAEAWLTAQQILNAPDSDKRKRARSTPSFAMRAIDPRV
jgi:hypothetical protein